MIYSTEYTLLVPILKNKNGDIASKSNYRPIALSTVVSKNLEIILINPAEEYIVITENQFAYKKGHSTIYVYIYIKRMH